MAKSAPSADNPHVANHRERLVRNNRSEPAAVDLDSFLAEVGPAAALRSLTALLPDAAVFAVDAERNIVCWSEGAERLLGYRQDEVVGRYCLHANRCHQCMIGCGISEHGQVRDVPLVLLRRDEEPIAVRKTARAFRSADGTFLGGIEVLVADSQADDPRHRAVPADAIVAHGILSRDPAVARALEIVRNVAATDAPVLIRGESGTGKELFARAVHDASPRAEGPFIAVNCASLSPALLESELFGHKKGAFTGAVRDHPGVFSRAGGGTLFLDEVAEMPQDLQARLLRVLEDGSYTPVGGEATERADVRVVSATHRSLREMVKGARFREDLMYRLRVVPIFLPPLRERRGDVELLLWHFIEKRNAEGRGRRIIRVAPDAMRALLDHGWPGNVRELKNVVDYAFAVGRGSELSLSELPPELLARPSAPGQPATLLGKPPSPRDLGPDELRLRVEKALEQSGGHIGEACTLLGVSRPTLWRWRKTLGL
ncbi:MAG: sigma 54-interacting transcriptional regulator [Deltaproteobacteria bacterium]|nr:sigma 54-interacting transcriptional regulator [Deltaproteobacteria bacterium]